MPDIDDEDEDCPFKRGETNQSCEPGTCDDCNIYWDSMEAQGFWNRQTGWTAKGMREATK